MRSRVQEIKIEVHNRQKGKIEGEVFRWSKIVSNFVTKVFDEF